MYQDDPDYRAYLGCLQSLYPNTILDQDIAGSVDSIEEITVKDLKIILIVFTDQQTVISS